MEAIIAALLIGIIAGGMVGWKGGRLHLDVQLRYGDWRKAVQAVPVTYRSAAQSIKYALKYGATLALLSTLTFVILWAVSNLHS